MGSKDGAKPLEHLEVPRGFNRRGAEQALRALRIREGKEPFDGLRDPLASLD
jgi:hypothetical protein